MHDKIICDLKAENQKLKDHNGMLHKEIKQATKNYVNLEKKFTNLKSFYDKLCESQRALNILKSQKRSLRKK